MNVEFSLLKIDEVAKMFLKENSGVRVFAFHGEMGAGKTTFIHALCEAKKVNDVVGSPTFSIINEYYYTEASVTRSIYHMDLYRIKSEAEALQAGVEDCLYADAICFVEWPEKAPGIFPPETLHVYLELVGDQQRSLRW